jgi:hypothetical protein
MKSKFMYRTICGLVSCVLASLVMINEAKADGTAELGLPSIDINLGSYVLVEGTGLEDGQPSNITVDIPADVSIEQVLLYWSGRDGGDDTLEVDGTEITGMFIGGDATNAYTYRVDVTASNLVATGANSLSVGGLDFSLENNGAALVVILDDGSTVDMQIMDGSDLAYLPWDEQTVPVNFPVTHSAELRMGTLNLFVTDLVVPRPAALEIIAGGVTNLLTDVFLDNEGKNLDVVELEVPVPAGATNVRVQALSINDDLGQQPASLYWHFVSWVLPEPQSECGGGGLTPGFWQNKHGLRLIDEYDALVELNELCLREDNGDHAEFDSLSEFRSWIKSRRATNMAFQLSGHLAAMYMNVLVGSVNGDALVYIGHGGDTISIYNLINAADEALCEDGETFSGDENRDYQEMLKNALDEANNNLNWVYLCTSDH